MASLSDISKDFKVDFFFTVEQDPKVVSQDLQVIIVYQSCRCSYLRFLAQSTKKTGEKLTSIPARNHITNIPFSIPYRYKHSVDIISSSRSRIKVGLRLEHTNTFSMSDKEKWRRNKVWGQFDSKLLSQSVTKKREKKETKFKSVSKHGKYFSLLRYLNHIASGFFFRPSYKK